jgi:hypothetical protein
MAKAKPGRPFLKLDERQIKELADMGCTMEEMASVMGCHIDTLRDNYSKIIKEGRDTGNMSIRRTQQEVAVKDKNPSMLIWLGKVRLGQREVDLDEQSQKGDVQALCSSMKELAETIKNDKNKQSKS